MIFSVIIPTCNRNEQLGQCLERLKPGAQSLDALWYEVIVSDDGPDYKAEGYIQAYYPWVRYTRGPRRGPAANRNNGARLATGSWLVFTDDDCLPDLKWLDSIKTFIEANPDVKAVEGKTIAIGVKSRFDESAPENLTGGQFWSCNIALSRACFHNTGGFNEAFPYPCMEDIAFKERVESIERISFLPSAIVYHPLRRIKTKGMVRRLLVSNRIFLEVTGRKPMRSFRISRLKLFIHYLIYSLQDLIRYKGKGIQLYYAMCRFYFLMIFLRLRD